MPPELRYALADVMHRRLMQHYAYRLQMQVQEAVSDWWRARVLQNKPEQG